MPLPRMRPLVAAAACLLACTLVAAAPPPSPSAPLPPLPPKPLLAQVQRLTELLRDGRAAYYPEATLVQRLRLPGGEALVLAVFTVEGFGGGNNHTQYLAAFTPGPTNGGEEHFMLIDVIPIGGKGWRAVSTLDARAARGAKGGETLIAFDALAAAGNDAPNFPSRPVRLAIVLKNGRLAEQGQRAK